MAIAQWFGDNGCTLQVILEPEKGDTQYTIVAGRFGGELELICVAPNRCVLVFQLRRSYTFPNGDPSGDTRRSLVRTVLLELWDEGEGCIGAKPTDACIIPYWPLKAAKARSQQWI